MAMPSLSLFLCLLISFQAFFHRALSYTSDTCFLPNGEHDGSMTIHTKADFSPRHWNSRSRYSARRPFKRLPHHSRKRLTQPMQLVERTHIGLPERELRREMPSGRANR